MLNRQWCHDHGDCHHYFFDGMAEIEPHWEQVRLTDQLLQANACKSIIMMNTDAVILGHELPDIEALFNGNESIHICEHRSITVEMQQNKMKFTCSR